MMMVIHESSVDILNCFGGEVYLQFKEQEISNTLRMELLPYLSSCSPQDIAQFLILRARVCHTPFFSLQPWRVPWRVCVFVTGSVLCIP